MAILIKRTLPFKLLSCIKDTMGCYVLVRGVLYGEVLQVFICFYFKGEKMGQTTGLQSGILNFAPNSQFPTHKLTDCISKSTVKLNQTDLRKQNNLS